ncbi:NAD(P)-dependent oxidoreductase [Candidatus Ventrimonas sp. KK005]
MKAVVTGGAGFIGAATVKCLLEKGHEVWAVVRPDSPRLSNLWHQVPEELRPGLQVISLDVRNLAQEDFRKYCPLADVWLHTSWGGPGSDNRKKRDMQQSNIQDSLAAVRAAAWIGCRRFVFTGSQAEYGICYETMGEDTPCNPVSEYGKAKLEFANQAEKLCRQLSMDYVHARLFSVYGPGDHSWTLVQSCLRTWQEGGEMELGECSQWWNFLYIKDAAKGLAVLLEKGVHGIYNLAGRDTRILREYVEEMYELCGSKGSFRYGIHPQLAEKNANLIPDITKILALGWKPTVSFKEGIYELLHCL